jgi:hypothetical protein
MNTLLHDDFCREHRIKTARYERDSTFLFGHNRRLSKTRAV